MQKSDDYLEKKYSVERSGIVGKIRDNKRRVRTMKYKGAAIQFDCRFMEKEKNLSQLAGLIRQAAGQGAKLIVLPEMCATG